MLQFPLLPRRERRILTFAGGAALFLWLSVEDNTVLPAALAGVSVSVVGFILWLDRRLSGATARFRLIVLASPFVGAGMGVGGAALTAALMLVKNGMHGHIFPDYPFGIMRDMLSRAPGWAVVGALFLFGVVLAWRALLPEKDEA